VPVRALGSFLLERQEHRKNVLVNVSVPVRALGSFLLTWDTRSRSGASIRFQCP